MTEPTYSEIIEAVRSRGPIHASMVDAGAYGPCIGFVPCSGLHEPPGRGCRFGHINPLLPEGSSWPTDGGHQLDFLFQLDFTEISMGNFTMPLPSFLPKDGVMTIFLQPRWKTLAEAKSPEWEDRILNRGLRTKLPIATCFYVREEDVARASFPALPDPIPVPFSYRVKPIDWYLCSRRKLKTEYELISEISKLIDMGKWPCKISHPEVRGGVGGFIVDGRDSTIDRDPRSMRGKKELDKSGLTWFFSILEIPFIEHMNTLILNDAIARTVSPELYADGYWGYTGTIGLHHPSSTSMLDCASVKTRTHINHGLSL